ncbi:alpha-tubulin N-acetyltransferase 1-like [Lepisosteus oculatus]|uniref:alpha-tubulin N-acetyltransferase 1-like n=1 Tax=Lepisosteus oculatus TaxID=7918 RepID=UPI0035F51857
MGIPRPRDSRVTSGLGGLGAESPAAGSARSRAPVEEEEGLCIGPPTPSLPVSLSVSVSLCFSLSVSQRLSLYLSASLPVSLSVSVSLCLSPCVSQCLSVPLPLSLCPSALKEEQRGLPWPFNQAPPPSSPLGRSLSVGSSPSRGAPPWAPPALSALRVDRPRPPQLNGAASGPPRTRRTSQQGLVARGNLYSRHISSGTLRPSPEKRPAPPRQPGEPETDPDRPDWARTQTRDRAADTQDRRPQCSAQPPVPPLSLPLPPSCETESSLDQTPLTPPAPRPDCPRSGGPRDGEAAKAPDAGRDPPRAPPSPPRAWSTVVQPFTAQWVRRKQEYRSTRPW